MSASDSRTEEMGAGAWFALGTSRVGTRLVAAARIAAALHEDAARGLEAGRGRRGVGAAWFEEGVSVEERLMLLEGVVMEDVA